MPRKRTETQSKLITAQLRWIFKELEKKSVRTSFLASVIRAEPRQINAWNPNPLKRGRRRAKGRDVPSYTPSKEAFCKLLTFAVASLHELPAVLPAVIFSGEVSAVAWLLHMTVIDKNGNIIPELRKGRKKSRWKVFLHPMNQKAPKIVFTNGIRVPTSRSRFIDFDEDELVFVGVKQAANALSMGSLTGREFSEKIEAVYLEKGNLTKLSPRTMRTKNISSNMSWEELLSYSASFLEK